jgi:hypothetical protein
VDEVVGVEEGGGAPRTVRVRLVRCMLRCALGALCGAAAREVTVVQCALQGVQAGLCAQRPAPSSSSSGFSPASTATPLAAPPTAATQASTAAVPQPYLWERMHMLRHLVVWGCRGPHVRPCGDDALLHLVAHLPGLAVLAINANAATAAGLEHVGRLRQLRSLRIAVANIACATALAGGLARLRGLQRVEVCVPSGGTQFVLQCARDHLAVCLPGVQVQMHYAP